VKISKVLVPVVGRRTDDEALRLAFSISRQAKARIYVIFVIEVPRTRPLDDEMEAEIEKGERYLDQSEKLATEAGSKVETELLQAREVGPAIVDEAVERGVDAIVLGIGAKKRFGEYALGPTTSYVLKNAPCAVFICREAMQEQE
jgi:nucleotide-binding universal stress UspA family protein